MFPYSFKAARDMGSVLETAHSESTEDVLSGNDSLDGSELRVQLGDRIPKSSSTPEHRDVGSHCSTRNDEPDSAAFSESVVTGLHGAPDRRVGTVSSSPLCIGGQPLVVLHGDSSCGGYDLTDEACEITPIGLPEAESANPSVEGVRGHTVVDHSVSFFYYHSY